MLTVLVLSTSIAIGAQNESRNITSSFSNVNKVRIHYLRSGKGDKTPVILIHGFGETSMMWEPVLDAIGRDRIVIAPDLRGLGDSSKPLTGFDKKTAAADIHALAESLGFKHVEVVGHDIGLMVAYAYAAQYPEQVEKLALMEAPLPGIGKIWEQIFNDPRLWHFHFVDSPIALDLVKGRERLFLEHFWQTLTANQNAMSEMSRQAYARSYAQPGAMQAAFAYFQAFNRQDAEDNQVFAKSKLQMPVLTIAGDKAMGDALAIQARDVATNVTAIIFPNTGHWLMEERPVETKEALLKFLTK
jgi:pimeloyl-ACP methyl ester carboxylesterase